MKTLAVRQPYASLIVSGVKTVENRSWATKYRGPLAIYASKKPAAKMLLDEERKFCADNGLAWPGEFPVGGIVGVVDLVGIFQHADGGQADFVIDSTGDRFAFLSRADKARCQAVPFDLTWWDVGSLGWILVNPRQVWHPCTGRLGLYETDI